VRRARDLSGQRFGCLVALELVSSSGKARWRCLCDCGVERIVFSTNLVTGQTRSCGCLAVELSRERALRKRELTNLSLKRKFLGQPEKLKAALQRHMSREDGAW
jgi:hypothetical protein